MKIIDLLTLFFSFALAFSVHAKGDDRKGDTPNSEISRAESRKADIMPGASPHFTALVKEFLQVTHAHEIQEMKIDQAAAEASKGAKDPAKAKASAAQFYREVLSTDSMLPILSDDYRKHFSEDEMKKLIEFYKSPLGQKAVTGLAEISKQTEALSQQRLQTRTREFNLSKSQMPGFR